jgi:hypothetical protein
MNVLVVSLVILLLVFVNDARGSIVLFNFQRDRVIVAADSRIRSGDDVDDTTCKLVQVDPKTFFFAIGRTSAIDNSTKREILGLQTVAQEVFKQQSDSDWDGFVRLVARWTDLVLKRYQALLVSHREQLTGDRPQFISEGTFGRSFETGVRLYHVSFTHALPPEVAQPTIKPLSREIHPNDRSPMAVTGDRLAIALVTEFLENNSSRAKAANQIFQRQFRNQTEMRYEAQRLRSAIMAAIEWIPDKKLIGGKVDSLILEKRRPIEWISKKDCSSS